MKKSLPAVSASYDLPLCDPQVTWSHLVGIPYRLKDPPRILYHAEGKETRV